MAAPAVGIPVHRPERRLPWLTVLAMLTLWALSMLVLAVDADAFPAAGFLTQAGLTIATGLIAALFLARRRMVTAPGRSSPGGRRWAGGPISTSSASWSPSRHRCARAFPAQLARRPTDGLVPA